MKKKIVGKYKSVLFSILLLFITVFSINKTSIIANAASYNISTQFDGAGNVVFVVNVWGLPAGQHYVYHVSNITKNGCICYADSGPYAAGFNVVLWNGTHYIFPMNHNSAAAYGMPDWLGASLNGWMETVNCTKGAHCNCTQCGQHVGHNWKRIQYQAPTCTQAERFWYECADCKDHFQEEYDYATPRHQRTSWEYDTSIFTEHGGGLGHDWRYRVFEAGTCAKKQRFWYECDRCKAKFQEVKDYVPDTHTRTSYEYGASIFTEHNITVDHTWTWQRDSNATCTTNGTQHQHCSVCGANQNYGSVWQNALGHNGVSKKVSDATCTSAAVYHDICSRCGTETRGRYNSGNALGHAYDAGKITTYPTVYHEGVRTHTCSRCNSKVTTNEPQYHFNINVGYTPIKKIAKGNKLLFENTSMDADLIPFVSK